MIRKIRHQLLAILLAYSLICFIIILLSIVYAKKKSEIENIHNYVFELQTIVLQDVNIINDFFIYDTKNPVFFASGQSNYINAHIITRSALNKKMQELRNAGSMEHFTIHEYLSSINFELQKYQNYFYKIKDLIQQRGFKDDGTEGKMRDYVHLLEDIPGINLEKVLMLRRHEKDYIIRNEEKYIQKLLKLGEEFKHEIQVSPDLTEKRRQAALTNLENYLRLFQNMVALDRKIGIKDNTALRKQLNNQGEYILSILSDFEQSTKREKEKILKRLRAGFIVSSLLLSSLSILLSFYLSRRVTRNLTILSENINSFVKHDFRPHYGNYFPSSKVSNELSDLINNYRILRNKIIDLIADFQDQLEQRTRAIIHQKDKIAQQNEEITAQRDNLYKQKELLEVQKALLENRNNDIISSMQYARLIQDAMQPSTDTIQTHFPESFIFFQPKEIISGDFYWFKRIQNDEFNIALLAVADCTGHGVPGALMSMLGIAFLNEIVLRKQVKSADQVLNSLRENILNSLQNKQNNGHAGNDGMDIGLIMINYDKQTLEFSGANRPLYYFRDKQLEMIAGDKMSIGKIVHYDKPYSRKTIQYRKGDRLYLFTDGLSDQFGGDEDKKFKRKRIIKVLEENQNKNMNEQFQLIHKTFNNWKGRQPQTDDVSLIGIKI